MLTFMNIIYIYANITCRLLAAVARAFKVAMHIVLRMHTQSMVHVSTNLVIIRDLFNLVVRIYIAMHQQT